MATIKRVTLLGATGAVGRRVLGELLNRGIAVVAVSRQPRPTALSSSIEWHQADLTNPAAVRTVPWNRTLISTLFVSMTADILEQLPEGTIRRIVAFSSTSALTKAEAAEPSDREVSSRLMDGEKRLLESNSEVTILRPTMIYHGPGDNNVERIAWQLRRFPMFPLVGSGRGRRQPVHAQDLASAAVSVLASATTVGKAYNLGGGEVLAFREVVARVGSTNGVIVRFVPIPLPVAKTALRLLSPIPRFRGIPIGALERMSKDLVFDTSEADADFGFKPRPFEPPNYLQ